MRLLLRDRDLDLDLDRDTDFVSTCPLLLGRARLLERVGGRDFERDFDRIVDMLHVII